MSARYSKHTYELVAACLRCADEDARGLPSSKIDTAHGTVADIARRFALEFELDNPRFDRDRFLDACERADVA